MRQGMHPHPLPPITPFPLSHIIPKQSRNISHKHFKLEMK
jgi:hypothetical protein